MKKPNVSLFSPDAHVHTHVHRQVHTHRHTHTYEHPDKYMHIYYAICQIRENEEERVGERGRGKEDSS